MRFAIGGEERHKVAVPIRNKEGIPDALRCRMLKWQIEPSLSHESTRKYDVVAVATAEGLGRSQALKEEEAECWQRNMEKVRACTILCYTYSPHRLTICTGATASPVWGSSSTRGA
jgi:hypothetical protein